MKGYLACALLIIGCFWIKQPIAVACCMLVYVYYAYRNYTKRPWFHIICCVFFFLQIVLPKPPSKPMSQTFSIMEIKPSYVIAQCDNQKIVVYGLTEPSYGDVYTHSSNFSRIDSIHNKGMYHFRGYMNKRHIYYALDGKGAQRLHHGKGIRHALFEHIQKIQNINKKQLINAFLYGIQEREDASFFIVSSGMHLALCMRLLKRFLARYLSFQQASVICILIMLMISYLCVFTPSCLRILCFQCVRLAFSNKDTKDRLGCSIVFVLCLAPYLAYEMVLLLPVAFQLFYMFNVKKIPSWFLSWIVLLPFQFYYYHCCNIVQMLLFRILRYFYAALYICAWSMLLCSFPWYVNTVTLILQLLEHVQSWGITLYCGAGFIWCMWWVKNGLDLISYCKKQTYLEMVFALCMAFLFPYVNPFAIITSIDVGQGDCTLIQLPYKKGVVMIDVMGSLYKNIPKDVIVPYVHAQGITAIDALIITHDDYDHSGGLEALQKEIEVKRVIRNRKEKLVFDDVVFTFLMPEYQGESENDKSLVTLTSFYDWRFLFMGDLENTGEETLLQMYPQLSVDVLKAGHHGSKTSSSPDFLHQMHPQIALISAGRTNRYGHPSKETLQRMENASVYPLTTSHKGSISLYVSKYLHFYETASHEFGIIKRR